MGVTEFFDTPSELIAPQEPVGVPPVVAVVVVHELGDWTADCLAAVGQSGLSEPSDFGSFDRPADR